MGGYKPAVVRWRWEEQIDRHGTRHMRWRVVVAEGETLDSLK